ncbi:uncharacterized protein LOC18439088 isoform X1 [Amborella trichopoda]|uniref:uncharacterized protein LOC18439088 isoform X1 n=1 Tax=Amborella trichopoda TaxID=13333 RepID=UPI0005D31068|nr:uncharacterized protein LOC18439088 isoform X1 [Amborella trichopoda]|eukprot:XP_011625218.1 uncharacterized protein LOC18439088 isoform X1 [Amborella trichopoda]
MGRSKCAVKDRSTRKGSKLFDSDDDSLSTSSSTLSDRTLVHENDDIHDEEFQLEDYVDALYEKRPSTREKGLKGLVDAFSSDFEVVFAENKHVTLVHLFINSIKRGSSSEAALASHALGLLAITIGAGYRAHKILEEAMPHLSQALKGGCESGKRSAVLDCLAILTFVGGNDEDTEKSMELMWHLIHPKSAPQAVSSNKLPPNLVAFAISAWAFLLTTIPSWKADSKFLLVSASVMSSLLDKDDRSVRIAAGEALALIDELQRLIPDENESPEKAQYENLLYGKILNQVEDLSIEAGGKGSSKKDLNNQRSSFRDILASLETGDGPEALVKLKHGDVLKFITWTQLIQLNFLKHFLGKGFLTHMQENDLLQEIFDFTPRRDKQQSLTVREKRMFRSPNSAISKARTQLLKKKRSMAQDQNTGHFAATAQDDS